MNELTRNMVQDYTPELAIVVYSTKDKGNVYLESHDIDPKGRILAGKPLKQETIQGIVDVLYRDESERTRFGGLIPDNLLLFEVQHGGSYKMAWYTPAHLQQLYFAKILKIPSGTAWVPAMLWLVEGNSLRVHALDSDKRPELETQLYKAPFHNVGGNDVCLGSAKAKKSHERTYLNEIKYWEDMFWLSEFSHHNDAAIATSNINILWGQLVTDNSKHFPTEVLKPLNKKLKNILKHGNSLY